MSWKEKYFCKFKGRGKSWYKVPFNTSTAKIVDEFLKEKENEGCNTYFYREKTKLNNFYWISFQNIKGTKEDVIYMFEVRWSVEGLNHRKDIIFLNENNFKEIECLNDTPKKLGLTGEVKKVIKKESFTKKEKKIIVKDKDEILNNKEEIEYNDEYSVISDFGKEIVIKPCSPFTKIKLPGRIDKPMFREFLIKEGAI